MKLTACPLLVVFLLACIPGATTAQASQADEPSAVNAAQRKRESTRLTGLYRRARKDRGRQAELIDEAAAFGPAVVWQLLAAVEREMYPALSRYRTRFYQQASGLSTRRMREVNLEEVVRLRQMVLSLQKGQNFTKQTIIARGDPALARLEEVFMVERQQVLAGSERLQTERQALREVGLLWEQAAGHLYRAMPDDQSKPKTPPSFEEYLRGEERLAVGLSVPMVPQTRAIIAANARLARRIDPEEARTILALNLMRNLLGLSPLVIDLQLCIVARDHSNDMRRLGFFAHQSPLPGKTTPWDRARRFGCSASAENIFVGSPNGQTANRAWFHSPGHHVNMLGDHKRVGVGRSQTHFTELFGK